VKTHAISDMSREKKNPANTPQFYFILLLLFFLNAIWKKHHMQVKIKLDDANTKKQSLDLLFLSSPNKYL
jgi:hypothetical protein